MAAPTIMVLDPTDTVAVVLSDMEAGETRDGLTALFLLVHKACNCSNDATQSVA